MKYLSGIKNDQSVLIRAISHVRQFSANIQGDDFDTTHNYFEQCNAFKLIDIH